MTCTELVIKVFPEKYEIPSNCAPPSNGEIRMVILSMMISRSCLWNVSNCVDVIMMSSSYNITMVT